MPSDQPWYESNKLIAIEVIHCDWHKGMETAIYRINLPAPTVLSLASVPSVDFGNTASFRV